MATDSTRSTCSPPRSIHHDGLLHVVAIQPGLYDAIRALRRDPGSTARPGLYDATIGGVRLKDLVLVTDDGSQTLTQYPYGLAP